MVGSYLMQPCRLSLVMSDLRTFEIKGRRPSFFSCHSCRKRMFWVRNFSLGQQVQKINLSPPIMDLLWIILLEYKKKVYPSLQGTTALTLFHKVNNRFPNSQAWPNSLSFCNASIPLQVFKTSSWNVRTLASAVTLKIDTRPLVTKTRSEWFCLPPCTDFFFSNCVQ